MKKYLSRPENRYCADCKRPSPTWASLNLGVFVCIKCSGCHREIGVHITKIKSVELDLWPSKALTDFAKINNEIANAYWEYDLKNYDYQRIRDNEIRLIEFIRDKYEFKRWAKPRVPDPMSLVLQGRDLIKEFMNNGEAVKIYEKNEDPELEKRSQHFGRQKNEKKGKSFGIVDKSNKNESNNIDNNTNNNNQMNNNTNNNTNINNNNANIINKKPEKGFVFIKRKQNKNDNNHTMQNIDNNTNANNNIDLLGFGNEQNDSNINNINQENSSSDNNFPLDIFSIGLNQSNNSKDNINNKINNNINSNMNNYINNNINNNPNNINTNQNNIISINAQQKIDNSKDDNKHKSGFSFIKKKNINQNNQSNNAAFNENTPPSQSINNSNDINDIFNQNPIQNNNANNNTNLKINNNSSINQNNSNSTNNNNLLNIFENDELVDLFNIETPTSDAVLNLSKNLLSIYSEKEEDKNINRPNTIPNSNINSSSSNYNVLNMNYPNININNYYQNAQQNKNKIGMMNNNYGINPMMGYNYQPQTNYNNFGFWYDYRMNNNIGGQYMGMNMNNGPINLGFNYQPEFYKKENEIKKDEPKSILLNNNSFELNLKKRKEKDDPFKNLVHFK